MTNFPPFTPFDLNTELWSDYWARFHTFTGAHSIQPNKTEQVFLTNQTSVIYKLLRSYAKQLSPSTSINELSMKQITEYMKEQFEPTMYIVRERHNFWFDMTRKLGETIHELAARIRQDAVTCEFAAIKDPQDEALRTCLLCSVNNEAVLKATFRVKDEELTFAKAVAIANETEDASRVAKETVYGPTKSEIHKIHDSNHSTKSTAQNSALKTTTCTGSAKFPFPKGTCWSCDKTTHTVEECSQSGSICDYCQNTGHIEAACLQKRLALSTHRGVLLQCRLPFGIKSAPGYFQQIMEQLTSDLKGVAVYLDDIFVSGKDAQEHLQNLRVLLRRLDENGLRC